MKLLCLALLFSAIALPQVKAPPRVVRRVPLAPKADLLRPETLHAKAPAIFRARFTTTRGIAVIEVRRAWAPNGADRFYNLVRSGFFNDLYFFRVVAGFMAQFGVHSKPEIAQAWVSQTMTDDPVMQSNTRGMVTFAKSSMPDSRSTQIFINYGDNSRLDSLGFAPFGKVIKGMEVVDAFYSGYGEQSNDQTSIRAQGKAFLTANYPQLDRIITATIVPPAPVVKKK